MTRKTLKKWLIVIAALYLVFPRDVIPDFLGRGLGLVDDLLLIALLTYFYRSRLRRVPDPGGQQNGGQDQETRPRRGPVESSWDPYEILGIDASATGEEIRAAYRARMHEYHPDKVAHLGEALQSVAHRKSVEIQRAYEQLRRVDEYRKDSGRV